MRRLTLKKESSKKEKAWKISLGVSLILLMAAGPIGYAFFSGDNSSFGNSEIDYKGYVFYLDENGRWNSEIDGYTFTTTYNPFDTENISIDFELSLNEFYNKPLYFVNAEGYSELIGNIERFAERYQEVCLEELECEKELVVKNCSSNVVVFKESEESSVRREGNCIFIESPVEERTKLNNRIIFKLLGIQ